jgi:hypothetical protein
MSTACDSRLCGENLRRLNRRLTSRSASRTSDALTGVPSLGSRCHKLTSWQATLTLNGAPCAHQLQLQLWMPASLSVRQTTDISLVQGAGGIPCACGTHDPVGPQFIVPSGGACAPDRCAEAPHTFARGNSHPSARLWWSRAQRVARQLCVAVAATEAPVAKCCHSDLDLTCSQQPCPHRPQ